MTDFQSAGASTEPKGRDAATDLNSVLLRNIDAAEKRADERREERSVQRKSEASSSQDSQTAKSEPEAKGEDEGQGKAQPKGAGETKKAREKPDQDENSAENREKSAKKAGISEDSEKSEDLDASKASKASKASDNSESETSTDEKQAKKQAPDAEVDPDKPFAPKSWDEDERKAFDEAPPEVQRAVNKLVKNLQKGFTKKTMALAEDQRLAEEIKAVLKPHHEQRIKAAGITPAQKFAELANLEDAYLADPAGLVRGLIQQARLTPEQLGFTAPRSEQTADPEGQPQTLPEVAELKQQLAALTGAWSQATRQAQQRQQQSEQARLQKANNAIQQFGTAVDESGNALHPHLDRVWMHMLPIISDLHANPDTASLTYHDKLQRAYDNAVWANPDYRQQHQATLKARTEAQIKAAAEEARRAAEVELEKTRARSAASVKPRSSGSAPAAAWKPRSLDEALEAAARKHGL